MSSTLLHRIETKAPEAVLPRPTMKKNKWRGGGLLIVGYILSPLSWWNDAFVNIPISWLLASVIAIVWSDAFNLAFIAIYWFTNFAGLLLMHAGKNHLLPHKARPVKIVGVILMTIVYTAGIILLLRTNIIAPLHL
ncbi:hypothetical protein JXJ21_20915 [candidate division KSB1 bacterium]|nr:hypothetical protein [candidate division KSB1 bacterium]